MVGRWPKDLTCSRNGALFFTWLLTTSVTFFLSPPHPGAQHHMPSESATSVFQGPSRNWDLLPSLQNGQGRELGGAAVARAG